MDIFENYYNKNSEYFYLILYLVFVSRETFIFIKENTILELQYLVFRVLPFILYI